MADRRGLGTKTSAAVVDYVLEQLFSGALRSGDRIDHDQVGEALGISRLPVREALVILERDGIVSMKYHRGVFVEPFDAESILDDFEIMGLLSGVAVRRLASHCDQETVAVLCGLLADLRATRPADKGRIFELVSQLLIIEHRAGGSRRLRAQLRSHAGFLPHAFGLIDRTHAATVRAHALVLDAVIACDGDQAALHRLTDFRHAGHSVVRELRRRGVIEK